MFAIAKRRPYPNPVNFRSIYGSLIHRGIQVGICLGLGLSFCCSQQVAAQFGDLTKKLGIGAGSALRL
jgi:hypothetical protein